MLVFNNRSPCPYPCARQLTFTICNRRACLKVTRPFGVARTRQGLRFPWFLDDRQQRTTWPWCTRGSRNWCDPPLRRLTLGFWRCRDPPRGLAILEALQLLPITQPVKVWIEHRWFFPLASTTLMLREAAQAVGGISEHEGRGHHARRRRLHMDTGEHQLRPIPASSTRRVSHDFAGAVRYQPLVPVVLVPRVLAPK